MFAITGAYKRIARVQYTFPDHISEESKDFIRRVCHIAD